MQQFVVMQEILQIFVPMDPAPNKVLLAHWPTGARLLDHPIGVLMVPALQILLIVLLLPFQGPRTPLSALP